MAGRKRQAITGDPGTTWTNTGTTCKWQLLVNWHNSCARCIQYDRQIAPAWGTPFHPGCNCQSVPVWPGETAEPFADYREKIKTLEPHEQSRVMGRSVLTLVEKGVVTWDQAVSRSRILTLQQLTDKHNLTVDQLTKAGVSPYQAGTAWASVHTPVHQATAAKVGDLLTKLKDAGLTDQQVQSAVVSGLAGKVGGRGAAGQWTPARTVPLPTPPPAAPVVYAVKIPVPTKHVLAPMGAKQAALKPVETRPVARPALTKLTGRTVLPVPFRLSPSALTELAALYAVLADVADQRAMLDARVRIIEIMLGIKPGTLKGKP